MSPCPGCGAPDPPPGDGPAPVATHRYLVSSPACFAAFGELLAESYDGLEYRAGEQHQLRVDAWTCQHPGDDRPAARQALALCLMTLRLVLVDGGDPARGPVLHRQQSAHGPFEPLAPPSSRGATTVHDVLAAVPGPERERAVRAWAEDVWRAWEPVADEQVRAWLERTGTADG